MRKAVDVSSLLELRQLQQPGAPDAVGRIVSRFLEESLERLVALRAAIDANDPVALERAAHAFKGIAGTVGANEMLDLLVRIEQIGREGRAQEAASLVRDLESAFDRARPIYEREVRS